MRINKEYVITTGYRLLRDKKSLHQFLTEIESMPTDETEHEWGTTYNEFRIPMVACGACGCVFSTPTPYCPECGSKMKK